MFGSFIYLFFEFELSAYTLSHYNSQLSFFEIGSHELFAWAGFKLRPSLSLPPQKLGLQA
jgi:hypothetical protein